MECFKLPVKTHEPANTIFLSLTFCFCLFECLAIMAAPIHCHGWLSLFLIAKRLESGMSRHAW